jgi:hypothetical protein
MEITHDDLTQRLVDVETEQTRLDGLLDILHELKSQVHELQTTLKPQNNNETTIYDKLKKRTSSSHDRRGYVVCLMLNPKTPPEWSGKEWHRHGKGKCYTNIEQASQCLQQLKKRWPNYPFQVVER